MKRLLAVLLAVVMVLGMVIPASAAGNAQQENKTVEATELEGLSRLDNMDIQSAERVAEPLYADDEIVTVIVQLEEASVLDYYDVQTYGDSASAGAAVAEFLASPDAQDAAEMLMDEQQLVLEQIQGLMPATFSRGGVSTLEVEIVAQWTKIANAMAVKVPYGQLNAIRMLDGVSNAYVQKIYEAPITPATEAGTAGYSYDLVGISEVWEAGYTGEGMVIAVLDTGLDLQWSSWYDSEAGENVTGIRRVHEAFTDESFKSSDVALRWTEDGMASFLRETQLIATTGLDGSHIVYEDNALYKTAKVPFAADYADGDANVRPTSSDHGTHVSGTIAGYAVTDEGEVKFSGIAPDAQILAMKVFDDSTTGAQEYAIINALEDAAVLGADVMNLSLGSDNGFEHDDTLANEVYTRLNEKGILFMLSAGNAYNSAMSSNYGDYNKASDPEISMISAPAVYESGLAVASSNNAIQSQAQLTWTDTDGTEHTIAYQDPNDIAMKYQFGSDDDLAVNIIHVDGYGSWSDYYNAGFRNYYGYGEKGVEGIALVQRGELSFYDKVNNASQFRWSYSDYSTGSYQYINDKPIKAVLVYDNDSSSTELIYMSVEGVAMTSAFISGVDGAALAEACKTAQANGGYVTLKNVSKEDAILSWDEGGYMSEFSSWGAGPSLELKPEITAPGGNIWSAVFDNTYSEGSGSYSDYTGSYGMMSGTSMAAPHMSGISALVQQYIRTELGITDTAAVGGLADLLMVSTAQPLTDENGNYYSPRYQGAGLVNAANAIKTPAYISVEGQNVGKIELMDDPQRSGEYTFAFTVNNLSDSELAYEASIVLMRPDTITEDGTVYMLDRNIALESLSLGTVTVPANGSKDVETVVTLSDTIRAELDELFENGSYIEGFIILTSETEPQIGLPFLGFYGDWTAAPIFDESLWVNDAGDAESTVSMYEKPAQWGVSILGYFDGYAFYNLGQNIFDPFAASGDDPTQHVYYQENVTLSSEGIMKTVNDFLLYQKREAKLMVVEVVDAVTGELYYRDWTTYQFKSYYDGNYGVPIPSSQYYFTETNWDGTDLDGNILPSGTQCIMTITAYGDGEYPMTDGSADGYTQPVSDFESVYTGGAQPSFNGHEMDMTGDTISTLIRVDNVAPKLVNSTVSIYEEDGRVYMTGSFEDDGSIASIEVYPQVKRSYNTANNPYADPSYYEYGMDEKNPFFSQLIYDPAVGEYTFTADVTEYAHTNESYSGENYYYNFEWTGNVYIFGGDYGGNDRGYSVTVNDRSTEEGLILSTTSALLYVGESFDLSVINNTGSDEEIVRTSSEPEVASIDEFGHIEGLAPGQTTITISCGDSEAVCIVAVREKATEVIDFDLAIESFDGLKPNGSVVVKVINLEPANVELTEKRWVINEDDPDLYVGLINVAQYDTTGLAGEIYLNYSATNDPSITVPGASATLDVTLNGVTRSMTVNWEDLYTYNDDEDLVSNSAYGAQTIYVEQGETAELVAKYNANHSFIPVELYTMEGYQSYSYSNPTTPCTGLVLDGPNFASNGASWSGKLVALPGYELPDEIKVCTRYDYGYESEMYLNSYYGGYTYDPATGEIVVKQAPYGATNILVIRADGVAVEGAPGGTHSGTEWTRPDGTYGPFDWSLSSGNGSLETAENVTVDYTTKNLAYYTPTEPGVSYITATSKDGLYSVNFAVICTDLKVESVSIDNAPEYVLEGEQYALEASIDPVPVLEENQELVWTSYNPEVLTVDENGVVTAVSEGYAMVTAASRYSNVIDTVVIRVKPVSTVSFETNGGSAVEPVTVETGKPVEAPEAPTKAGFDFKGWYTDSELENKYDFSLPVTGDITLYARWFKAGVVVTPPATDDSAIEAVEELIDAIGEVTLESEEDIEAAREAYNDLTIPERRKVSNYDELVAAEKALAELKAEAEKPEVSVWPFTDVNENQWFYNDVKYVYEAGLMNGVSETLFAPQTNTTRGMIVTILWRMEGEPAPAAACRFEDVAEGTYYEKAVAWAAENGIVTGYTETVFKPGGNITREQFAAILYRYANYKGVDTGASGDKLASFTDSAKVSSYAVAAMNWAVGAELINGVTETTLEPQGLATRAQSAAMLHRFCENIAQ